jgi:hypothetical protein
MQCQPSPFVSSPLSQASWQKPCNAVPGFSKADPEGQTLLTIAFPILQVHVRQAQTEVCFTSMTQTVKSTEAGAYFAM